MSSQDWGNFWKNQKESFHSVMRVSTTYFAIKLEDHFSIKGSEKILDYGCGPGFLSDYFIHKNVEICGTDINASFIEQSKEKHPHSRFISISTDSDTTREILGKSLSGERFDLITLLSIVQYFKDEKELERTIQLLLPYLSDKGKIILADIIDEKTSSAKDAINIFLICIKKGKTFAFIRFVFYLLFSNYSDISKKTKLLSISEKTIRQISTNTNLVYQKVEGLTPHPTRTNYVLEKANS